MTSNRLAVLAASALALTACAVRAASAVAATHPARDAARLVETIYGPYKNATVDTATLGNCFVRSSRPCATKSARHVPAALQAKLRRRALTDDDDPVICSQNSPRHITYGTPRVHGSLATIVVHTVYSGAGAPRTEHPITVTVDLRNLRLSSLTCGRRS